MTASMEKGVSRAMELASARQIAAQSPPLEARPHPWLRNATITAAGGTVFASLAPIVDQSVWTVPIAAVSGATAIGVGALGYRTKMRDVEVDRAIEQLSPQLGLAAPSRETIKASRWDTRGWPGRPGRLVIRYASAKLALDEHFIARINEVLSGQAWGEYRLQKHDTRRRRIIFVPTRASDEKTVEEVASIARAKRTVLTLLGPTGKITSTEFDPVTGDLCALEATHEVGTKIAPSGYRNRIERTVSGLLAGRWRARWNLETDWVRFEVRPNFPTSVWHPAPAIADDNPLINYDSVKIPYGIDEDGNVMHWRPAVDPHMMLVGSSGTGKTVTAHTVLTEVAANGWIVWVVDGKGIEFLGFQDWPNVQVVAAQIAHQVAVIHRAWQVMEERYTEIIEGKSQETDFEPLVLFIDEFADFRGNLLNWYSMIKGKGDPTKPRTLQEVGSIARKGRTARVHMVLGTQRPDAEYFGGDMRDNFRMRVSMGRLSPQGAQMMWESMSIGTSIPRGCRGRATTINDANDAVEIQTYRTPDPRKVGPGDEGYELFEILRPTVIRHPRLLILDPEPDEVDIDKGDSEEVELRFHNYATAPWGRAEDHPYSDPVALRVRGKSRDNARSGTPLEILGIYSKRLPRTEDLLDAAESAHARPALTVVPELLADDVVEDDWEGFSEPASSPPGDIQVGDLICVDEDSDHWVLVDSDPGPDEFDEDHYAITWRGDGDSEGVLSVPGDGEVSRRRALEFA